VRLLIVEDDPNLSRVLRDGFREQSMNVTLAATYSEGRTRALKGTPDVIVLDIMLPGGTGFALCTELRQRGLTAPILMLTARDSVNDRVRGLEVGADDYLTKPFAFRELLARVRALGRRGRTQAPRTARVGDLEVNLATRRVTRAGRAIDLTAKEFALLEVFIRHAGEVLDRAAITAYVWDENHDPFTNVLEVLVRRLRAKIDDDFEPKLIQTLRGAGYRFGP
jgi:two-component system, OmpR family, copper resistance phosphate regulon response regulator CusR